jgi:hypothetical protein
MNRILNYLNKHPLKCFAVSAGFILLVGLAMQNPSPPSAPEFTPAQRAIMAVWINADGYDCADAYLALRMGNSIDVLCHGSGGQHYSFELENHGGKWSISAD